MSDFWQCDYGARSLEARMDENNITVAEWIRTTDSITDERMDHILDRIAERSRSK